MLTMVKVGSFIILFCLSAFLGQIAGAETLVQSSEALLSVEPVIKLKDVPTDHWAASAVYDLVRLGVTKGYPDGTFRGNKPINRYETAIFLSKLAKAIGGEDIKADISSLKDQIAELKRGPRDAIAVSGNYEGDWKSGNLLAASSPNRAMVANYRLIVSASRELGEGADVKVNLDTMDFGYYDDGSSSIPGRGLLASELFDVESNLSLDQVKLKFTYGRGPKEHAVDPTGVLPSEVGVTYLRPNTGILASTKLGGLDVNGGVFSMQGGTSLESSGKVSVSRFLGSVGYTFDRFLFLNGLRLDLSGDYMSSGIFSVSGRNLRGGVSILAPLGEKTKASANVGVGSSASKMMVSGTLDLNDPMETGTVVSLKLAKVGAEFISQAFADQQFDFAGYDYFNRPLINGTVNFGGELVQSVSDKVKLIGKGDLRLDGNYKYQGNKARLTAQGGVAYDIAPNTNLEANYRVHQDKGTGDTSDLAAVGLMYRF